MKLDAKAIRYLTSEDFRVLAAVLIGLPLGLPRDVLPLGIFCRESLANM